MKKIYLFLLALLCTVGTWAEVLPTEDLKASSNLPTGTPEYQFYIRQTRNNGQYWTPTTTATQNKANAGKFAFYAVPGMADCYYIYNVDQKKWVNYTAANNNNMANFASLAENFNANAYWEITKSTLKNQPTVSCFQMRPTVNNNNPNGNGNINTGSYANWNGGANASNTLGVWQNNPTQDEGSAWSIEAVAPDNTIKMAQEIALANRILETEGYAYTKGEGILTAENVTTIITSPYTHNGEGSIAGMADGNASTYWHSDWSAGGVINGSHYIVANIGDDTPDVMSFTYKRRNGNAGSDQTTRWAVYGVPADETGIADGSRDGLTLLAVVYTPFTNQSDVFENLPPFQTKGFKKFRLYSERTNANRGYFHIGELQFNGMTPDESNADNLKALAAGVATAEAIESPTEDDINNLKALIGAFNASDEEMAAAQALLDKTGIGYPSATSAARVALATALAGEVSSVVLPDLVAAYKASTEIDLPEDGRAYRFAFVDKNGNEYKIGNTSTTISPNADAADVFYCRKFTNVDGEERFAFITAEGKFLAYSTTKDNYTTHIGDDKRLQTEFAVLSMVGSTSRFIDASLKEQCFGTVYLKTSNRALRDQHLEGTLILKLEGKSFDNSNEPYFSDRFVSAIKVTEVTDYTASDVVLRAASTIAPLVKGYNMPIGTNLQQYTATFGGNDYTTFNDLETAIQSTTTVIADGDVTYVLNMPSAGFYRIKSMNANDNNRKGKYVQNTGALSKDAGSDGVNSVFYFDESKTFLSFASGQYLNGYGAQADAGVEGKAWTISENPSVVGAYSLKVDGNGYFLSDWTGSSMTNGQNDGNAAWAIEAVAFLPIPMNEEVGYATLYSPVSLGRSYGTEERVKVYTASVNADNTAVELNECTEGVPANTGVVLTYVAGIQSDGCVYLPFADAEITGKTSDMTGTFAATMVEEDGYVLSKPAEKEVGLYKALKNQNDDTAWKNNGFKAYLPASALHATGGAGAQSLRFMFGTETAIENVEAGQSGKAVIYDLSGRRVKNAQKGIFIINGKKVVK